MKPRLKPTLFFFSLVMTSLLVVLCFPMLVHAAQGIRARTKSIRGRQKSIRGGNIETAPPVAVPPVAVALAYLQCYPLSETAKKACQDKINPPALKQRPPQNRQSFIYEAERLGFATFLRQQGKTCARVDEDPRFNKKQKAYSVQCVKDRDDASTYLMRFDGKAGVWQILD